MVDIPEHTGLGERVHLGRGVVEVVGGAHILLGGGDEAGKLIATIGPARGLVGRLLAHVVEGRLPDGNVLGLVPDGLHDVAERVLVRLVAEEDEIFATLAVVLARVRLVVELGERAGDVGARETKNALVGLVGAETKVDATRAFEVRCLVGRDRETGSQGEGLPELGRALQLGAGVKAHKLRLAVVVGLDEGYVSPRVPGILEIGQTKMSRLSHSHASSRNSPGEWQ